MITKVTIEGFFMNVEEHKNVDLSQEIAWGFYFLDKNKILLPDLAKCLEESGYKFKEIFKAEKDEEEQTQEYYLHVQKFEFHNVSSLIKRCQELYEKADTFGVKAFDGFDIDYSLSC